MAGIIRNLANDRRRDPRQWTNFNVRDDAALMDVLGVNLERPGEDRLLPPFPSDLWTFKPCLFLPIEGAPMRGHPEKRARP